MFCRIKVVTLPYWERTLAHLPSSVKRCHGWSLFPRPASHHQRTQPTARTELSAHLAPHRPRGLHHVLKNPVRDVLLKDSQVAVFVDVFLQRLQLQAELARLVANSDGAEVRQPGLGTHRGKFRNVDLDLVAGK